MYVKGNEGEAVWAAIQDYLEHRTQAQLARLLGMEAVTIRRWIAKGEVSTQSLPDVIAKFEQNAIDWARYLKGGGVWNFENVNYWDALNAGPLLVPSHIPDAPGFKVRFLGRTIGSPFGVGPSIATGNSKWVKYWADLHFDVLTYKTVRHVQEIHQPHLGPHAIAVPINQPWELGHVPTEVFVPNGNSISDLEMPKSMANSVGIPSMPTKYWVRDIRDIRENVLKDSQFLIVSVAGTGASEPDTVENFIECATKAAESGADAVELNASCPNIFSKQEGVGDGLLYQDAKATAELSERVVNSLRAKGFSTPLLLKIGYLEEEALAELVEKTRGIVDGYTAINAVAANVNYPVPGSADEKIPCFSRPQGSAKAGITGAAVRNLARSMVRRLNQLRGEKKDFVIIGLGGISGPDDVIDFLDSGADVVQSCTAALFDRFLAINTKKAIERSKILSGREGKLFETLAKDDKFKAAEEIHQAGKLLGMDLGFGEIKRIMEEYYVAMEMSNSRLLRENPRALTSARTTKPSVADWRRFIQERGKNA